MTARPSESLGQAPKVESNITLKFVNFSPKALSRPLPKVLPKPFPRAAPEAPRPYEYKALTAADEIRYVQILANTDDAPLCCKIVHHTLQNNQLKYAALSYTWGDPEKTFKVAYESTSSGIYLSVTKNSYLAMKRLRDNDKSTSIWIDAICIDQSNIPERNSQVAIMDQIYAKATNTVIYLGEEENDSENGMTIIRSLGSNRNFEEMIFSPRNKAALSKLLDRAWCNRIWVLQEVFDSNSISVVCGLSEVSWTAMTNLSQIIQRYQGCASSDLRDKVFALASIITDKKKYNLQPDYGMSIESVFVNLVTSLLDTKGLDFLLAVQFLPSGLDLPSWVPDWTQRFGMGYINEINPLARAGGTHRRSKATIIHFQSLYDHDIPNTNRLILQVRGIQLGEIKMVSDVQALGGPGWQKRLLDLSYLPKARDDKKSIEDKDSKQSALPKPSCTCCPITQKGSQSDINWRTITARRAGDKPPTSKKQIFQHHSQIIKTMDGCKLFTTKCGFLGRTPTDVRPGDVLCVFLGAVAPCILRKHGRFWLLVGGYCFVDGAMNGEALRGLSRELCQADVPLSPLIDFLIW